MNVNPTSLKKLWETQQRKDVRRTLNPLKQLENKPNSHTDYVNNMNVTDKDKAMDSDLEGQGGSSLGVGMPDTLNPSY